MATDTTADKAQKTAEKPDWLSAHIKYLSALKTPTDTQKLLLSLAAKKVRDTKDERTLALLIKSEKALERAKKARAEVSSLLVEEKRKAAKEERAGRTHKLIQLGLLFSYAELDEFPREFLAGLLIFGGKTPEDERRKFSQIGAQLLALKEPKKIASVAPVESPTPAPPKAPAKSPKTASMAPAESLTLAPRPAPPKAPAESPKTASMAPAESFISSVRLYLVTNFDEREKVRALGARWDADREQLYVPPGTDARTFLRWIKN